MNPYLSIQWNDNLSGARGWLVVFNFVKGYTGGGLRMHPSVTHEGVARMAEILAYKYKASESEFCGGCMGGIAYDSKAPDAPAVMRRYLIAMMPYIKTGVSLGGDLGTRYADLLQVFQEFGMELPVTKSMAADPQIMKNIKAYNDMASLQVYGRPINDVMAGYGVACAADEAWKMLSGGPARVVIQGMGRVGSGCALRLAELGHKVVGMADSKVFVSCDDGVDIDLLSGLKKEYDQLTPEILPPGYRVEPTKNWLSKPCDIIIPAALGNVIHGGNAGRVQAPLIVEGANGPLSPEADEILKQKGCRLICDFTANLLEVWLYDAVIFGTVPPVLDEVLKQGEQLCRRNARKQMECALQEGRYARESARELFAPTTQDLPEV